MLVHLEEFRAMGLGGACPVCRFGRGTVCLSCRLWWERRRAGSTEPHPKANDPRTIKLLEGHRAAS